MARKIVFFNNKGRVGKTTLVYHTAWMLSELNYRVLAVDLDPQANLSSMFLSDERAEEIFSTDPNPYTIIHPIRPLIKGIGDIQEAHYEEINQNLFLLIGDLELSAYEDRLSENWTQALNKNESAFRFISAFYRIIEQLTAKLNIDVVLIDVGPNLGAINRVTLVSADFIILPVASDLFSLQGMKNLGKALIDWREQWQDRYNRNPEKSLNLPQGKIQPLGYIIMQYQAKESRPVKAYLKWANRIPDIYEEFILNEKPKKNSAYLFDPVESDSNCLGLLKHYHSLMPMAMESRKPIFLLKPADGAIGSHLQAVKRCYDDFESLANKILQVVDSYKI